MPHAVNHGLVIIGGTFDPVHFGHLRAALELREILQVDEIRLLPAGFPPHRESRVTDATHRLEMLNLAVGHVSGFSVDERELHRPGPSYMVDTLAELREEIGPRPLILAMGQDSANSLRTWSRWRKLFSLAHMVVMTRPGGEKDYDPVLADEFHPRESDSVSALFSSPAGRILHQDITRLAISSSGIRKQLSEGKSARFLLPERVLDYVEKHGLYT